ncbi:MAG: response regulator transcription factor [Cyanobacteriota bacterium]|nr:response regulator transcription factor [Cyanobacteriota bacterium]
MRLLLVEDDRRLAETLMEALTDQRYTLDLAGDGEAGWELLCQQPYDLVLMDVMLPKLDGIGLCRRVRQQGLTIPILMITARDTSADKVLGLDAGADDYLIKPVDLPELLARVRALLRRRTTLLSSDLHWGSLHLNPLTYEVTYAEFPLHLTPKEFALLELFLRSGRRVLSRRAIIDHLWNLEDTPAEDSIKAHIKALRQKLRSAGASEDCIETIHSVGYRLKQSEPA